MILLNETLREETKSRLEKGEKIRTCFHEISTLQKDREKLSSKLTKQNGNTGIHLLVNYMFVCVVLGCW